MRAPPVSFGERPVIWAAVVFLVSLALYTYTLAPTVTLVDSGELIVASHSLGVAHPPGFPFYLILAHLASIIPIGSVAQRVNFESALFAALASGALTLVVAELLNGHKSVASEVKKRAAGSESCRSLIVASAVGAGLLFASARTLWTYATIAEVYSLNSLLILVIILLLLLWRRQLRKPAASDAFLYLAAAVFGLALGVHHVTVALILPGLAVIVYQTAGAKFFREKRFLITALCATAAMLIIYSYLPIAAASDPLLNWGNPRSFHAIWAHVTGWQYRVFLSFSPGNIKAQLPQFIMLLAREFGPIWLPLAIIFAFVGFVAAFKRERSAFFFLLLIVLADVGYVLNYDIAEDKDAYYLPTFIAIAIAAGLGLHDALQSLKRNRRWIVVPAALVLPAIALAGNWPFNNRRHDFIAHDYIENILASVDRDGLLLTADWQVASPMLYTRAIEKRRTDVQVVDVQLLRRSWYFDYLKQTCPQLIDRSRDKIDIYVAELKQWERDPGPYAKNPVLQQQISAKFEAMCESMVVQQRATGPAYVTTDIILTNAGPFVEFTRWINENFQAVPRGLVFQLTPDRDFHDPGPIHLQTRGLADGTMHFDRDDVVNLKVLPVYTTMLVNRGRYLAHFGETKRALDAFAQALALNPDFDLARDGFNQTKAELEKTQ